MVHSKGFLFQSKKIFVSGKFLDSLVKRGGQFIPTGEIDKLYLKFRAGSPQAASPQHSQAIADALFHFTSFAKVQPTTSPDEDQFLHQPTDTFEAIGIQADPLPITLPEDRPPTGQLLLKMNQTSFPDITEDFTAVTGRVEFVLATGIDPRVLGSRKEFMFRILVHNLTGADRTEKKIDFVFSQQRQQIDLGYIGLIPKGSERIRIELQAFTKEGFQASNVFNESHVKQGVIPPPPVPPISERECNCRGVIKKVRIGEPCPVCKELPPEPIEKQGIFASIGFDTLIIGGLAVAALMPRGDKKK